MRKSLWLLIFICQIVGANTALEKKRFYKCYSIFVRQAMPESHPLWIAVVNGEKSGADACMDLINKAKLGPNGMLSNTQDVEAINILKRFSEWSRSFVSGSIGSEYNASADVIDAHGAAHYFTRSILKEDAEYKDIVTLNYGLMAKRSSTVTRQYSIIPIYRPYKYNISSTTSPADYFLKFWQGVFVASATPPPVNFFPRLVETGNLLGLVPDQPDIVLTSGFGSAPFNGSGKVVNQHFGGGALGTQSYLLGNIPVMNFLPDGGLKLHRTLGKNILQDFLCRSAPYLRSTDVASEVNSDSDIAFRTGMSCMGCHAAQDNIAAVTRNLIHLGTNNMSSGNKYGMRFIADTYANKLPTTSLPTNSPDLNFYKQIPSGRLFYRSYSGAKIDLALTDLSSLGESIAAQDDFYVCGVKRFYKELAGIDVDLSDPGDINFDPLSPEHQGFQNKVISWGLQLKNSQDMLGIIKEIISSPEFVTLEQLP